MQMATGGFGSPAGSRVLEKLPLKTKKIDFLPGRLRLAGLGGEADPGGKSHKKAHLLDSGH
jgi:hypothetical protein